MFNVLSVAFLNAKTKLPFSPKRNMDQSRNQIIAFVPAFLLLLGGLNKVSLCLNPEFICLSSFAINAIDTTPQLVITLFPDQVNMRFVSAF